MEKEILIPLARGVEYSKKENIVLLIRCPKCNNENYAPNVALGICTWCGFNAWKEFKDKIDEQRKSS